MLFDDYQLEMSWHRDEDFLPHLLDKEATAFGVLRFVFVYLL